MGKQQVYDIVIVGGGPSGATAALYANRLGLSALIVDKSIWPRDKICGDALSGKVVDILKDLDLTDDSMMDTPNRLGKMFVNEIFWGLDYDNFPKCTAIKNTMSHHDTHGSFVLERNVNVMSTCEHHFVPIDGKACVAYIPKDKVLGLSKLNRIVEFYSKRPQVQERLTEQIRAALSFVTETDNVAVYIDAAHFCVKTRGIQDVGSSTVTLSVGGLFAEDKSDIRREFLNLARMP